MWLSDDVAAALADVAVEEPVNGMVELAGPEQIRLDELVRRFLSATPPDAIARAIAFAIEQPAADVDVNEIVIRPTAQG